MLHILSEVNKSDPTFEDFLRNPPSAVNGGSDMCVPELSDSHRGMTLNAGSPGGMLLEEGDVSLDLELSIQESESDMFWLWLASCGSGRAGLLEYPPPPVLSLRRDCGDIGW